MIAFAYYRLPYLHHAIYVAQHEGEPEVLSSVAELNGKEGFVIAPFRAIQRMSRGVDASG